MTSGLRSLQTSVHDGEAELEQLRSVRRAAAQRQEREAGTWKGAPAPLVEELQARDQTLAEALEALRAQVHALHRACDLLERQRSRYVDLFMEAPDACFVTDLGGIVTEANLAAGSMFGVQAALFTGRPLIGFVARNDTRAFRELLGRVAAPAHAGGIPSFVLRMRARGGPVFLAMGRASAIFALGEAIELRWTLRRLDSTEALEPQRQALAAFARSMAADLRVQACSKAHERMLEDLGELSRTCDAVGGDVATRVDLARIVGEAIDAADAVDGPDTPPPRAAAAAVEAVGGLDAGQLRFANGAPEGPVWVRARPKDLSRAIALLIECTLEAAGARASSAVVRLWVGGGHAIVAFSHPGGADVATGRGVRTALARRLVERCGGELLRSDHVSWCCIRLPSATKSDRPAGRAECVG